MQRWRLIRRRGMSVLRPGRGAMRSSRRSRIIDGFSYRIRIREQRTGRHATAVRGVRNAEALAVAVAVAVARSSTPSSSHQQSVDHSRGGLSRHGQPTEFRDTKMPAKATTRELETLARRAML